MLLCSSRRGTAQLLVAAFLLVSGQRSAAEDEVAPGRGTPAWREVSAGGEATRNAWSLYSTATVAPLGALDEDGLRLRSVGGYGRYHYDGSRTLHGERAPTVFHGINSFTDLMLGYQLQLGRVTLKGFAGGSAITHAITPFDRDNTVTGFDIGFKAALEMWAEIGADMWTSADLSWTAAHETYGSRLRSGWRMLPELSLGVEAGASGNAAYDGARGGLFLRYAPDWGELSVAGGLSGAGGVTGHIDKPLTPYATANWLMRY